MTRRSRPEASNGSCRCTTSCSAFRPEAGEEAGRSSPNALISEGELSKAAKTLESDGLGNLCDPRVASQFQAKPPARKESLPLRLADYDAFRRVTVDLAPRSAS